MLSFLCVSTIVRVMTHVSKRQCLLLPSEEFISIRRGLCIATSSRTPEHSLEAVRIDNLQHSACFAAIAWETGDDPALTMPEIPREYFTSRDAGTLRVCNELYMQPRGKIIARLCKLLIMRPIRNRRDVIISAGAGSGRTLIFVLPLSDYNIAS